MPDAVRVTYADLVGVAQQGLPKLLQVDMQIDAAMKLRRLARAVAEHLNDYDEMRRALIDRHQVLEDGKPVMDGEGNPKVAAEFWGELSSLLSCEAGDLQPVSVADLGDIKVSAATLLAMGSLLVEESANGKAKSTPPVPAHRGRGRPRKAG